MSQKVRLNRQIHLIEEVEEEVTSVKLVEEECLGRRR